MIFVSIFTPTASYIQYSDILAELIKKNNSYYSALPILYSFDILFIGQEAENAAAIRYGIFSDYMDKGKDAGDAAWPRIRTDASLPFALATHNQNKNHPFGWFCFGSGEGRAGVCKDSPSDPARNAYFRPAKAAPARSPSVPLKYRSSFSKADSGMLHISGQYASPFAIVLPPFSDAERKAGVLCCIPEKKKVPEKGLFNVDGFFSSRGNTGPLIQTGGCRNCRGRFCRDPIRCVRSVPSCRGLCRPAR